MNSLLTVFYWAHSFATASVTAGPDCSVNPGECDTGLPGVKGDQQQLQQVLTIVLAVIGAVTVMVIVIAGIRFIAAQGNPQEVAKARSTLLYAIVGLIVVAISEGMVAFVLGKVSG